MSPSLEWPKQIVSLRLYVPMDIPMNVPILYPHDPISCCFAHDLPAVCPVLAGFPVGPLGMLGIVTCPEVHGEDLGEITVIPIVHRFGAELLLSWFICRGAAKTIWLMVDISIVDGCVNQQT